MTTLGRYSALQRTLLSLEKSLGLNEFNTVEKLIIAALSDPSIDADGVSVQDMMQHSLLEGVPQATLYRAIKRLKGKKFIEVAGENITGNYRIAS